MKHFLSLCLLILAFTPFSYAQNNDALVNPESINPTTRLLSYKIEAKNITISSYGAAHPSHFKMTLCDNCEPIIYQLKKGALLESNGYKLDISKLTDRFTKKNFHHVGLGINRDKGEITRISLNPINKELQERPKLENES